MVELDSTGNAAVPASDVASGSTDNCSIQSVTVMPPTLGCERLGSNMVTATVRDSTGNLATCDAMVFVEDNIGPTATCQSVTVTLNEDGESTLAPSSVDNGSTDNCEISMTLSQTQFTFEDALESPVEVTLRVTDRDGNTSECSAEVTVIGSLLRGGFERVRLSSHLCLYRRQLVKRLTA